MEARSSLYITRIAILDVLQAMLNNLMPDPEVYKTVAANYDQLKKLANPDSENTATFAIAVEKLKYSLNEYVQSISNSTFISTSIMPKTAGVFTPKSAMEKASAPTWFDLMLDTLSAKKSEDVWYDLVHSGKANFADDSETMLKEIANKLTELAYHEDCKALAIYIDTVKPELDLLARKLFEVSITAR